MLKMSLSSNINVDGLKACQNQPLLIFLFKTIATAKVNSTIEKFSNRSKINKFTPYFRKQLVVFRLVEQIIEYKSLNSYDAFVTRLHLNPVQPRA